MGLYFLIPIKLRNVFLLIASYTFYGWWDYRFLSLLFISTYLDFFCSQKIDLPSATTRKRKFYLIFAISGNLIILGFFKYFNFFSQSFESFLNLFNYHAGFPTLNIILPVGLSFYTFQSMSYTIDVYRRKVPSTNNLINFMLYVSFFPQLVAGPIERAQNLLPQIENENRSINVRRFWEGCFLIISGLFRKIIIADTCGLIVDRGFDNWRSLGSIYLWQTSFLFFLQIYCDFSGYSNIARGVAKWFGVELTLNFKQPFFAQNCKEYLSRWHISLYVWIKEYIYFSLGGSRKGTIRTYFNLFVTFFLMGLWHGASLSYIFFGLTYFIFYVLDPLLFDWIKPEKYSKIPKFLLTVWKMFLQSTIRTIPISVLFRNLSLLDSFEYCKKLFSLQGPFSWYVAGTMLFYFAIIVGLDLISFLKKDDFFLLKAPLYFRISFLVFGTILILFFMIEMSSNKPYIYFQF